MHYLRQVACFRYARRIIQQPTYIRNIILLFPSVLGFVYLSKFDHGCLADEEISTLSATAATLLTLHDTQAYILTVHISTSESCLYKVVPICTPYLYYYNKIHVYDMQIIAPAFEGA